MHKNLDILKELKSADIHVLFFPSNTSHFIQPLDGAPFAVLKNKINAAFASVPLVQALGPQKLEVQASIICYHVEREAFTVPVIHNGFRERGIFPWNVGLIMTNFLKTRGEQQRSEDDELNKYSTYAIKSLEMFLGNNSLPQSPIKVKIKSKSQAWTTEALEAQIEEKKTNEARLETEKKEKAAAREAKRLAQAQEKDLKRTIREEKRRMAELAKQERKSLKELRLRKKTTKRTSALSTPKRSSSQDTPNLDGTTSANLHNDDSETEEVVRKSGKKRQRESLIVPEVDKLPTKK